MNHTFDTVDDKVAEAEFFLQRMAESGTDMFAFKCYLSAYLSASRTTTLALQQFKSLPGFDAWYEPHRDRLKSDPLAKFLLEARNSHVHGGPHPVSSGRFSMGEAHYFFAKDLSSVNSPSEDVLSTCRSHFITLLGIVYDCYVALGVHIDPQQHYTKEHFDLQGRTIDDAELEVLGWVRTSLIEEGYDRDGRWHELRGQLGECGINNLFFSYLGHATPQPIEPDEYADFAYSPEERGWLHIPAGFDSIGAYRKACGIVEPDE